MSSASESNCLDSISGDEAKAILHQLGYFASDTIFMSLRLKQAEFEWIQSAMQTTELTTEGFLAALCEQHVNNN